MNNLKEKYLPLGSIVLLKNGSKRLMITGFCVSNFNDKSQMFDYCGCLYPEGLLSIDQIALFNHEQIDVIYYLGLSDDEEKKFKIKLMNTLNNTVKSNIEENSINNTIINNDF